MIIDAHVHIKKKSWKVNDGTYSRLLEELNDAKVDKALVIAVHNKSLYSGYDTKELINKFSSDKRLVLIGSIDILNYDKAYLHFIERCLKDGAIKGIKIYPGYQHIYLNDKRAVPVYKLCEKYGSTLVVHTGDTYKVYPGSKVKYSHPLHVDEIATDFPRMNIVMAHLGNPWTVDGAEVIYKNDNVYADISGFLTDFESEAYNQLVITKINQAIAYAGADKLLFGSDWPIISIKRYLQFMLSNLKLGNEAKEKFLFKNAKKLFKL